MIAKLGDILAELRKDKGLLQRDIANLLKVSSTTVSNYEKSIHCPDLESLVKISDFFDVSTDYLLGRTEYMYEISKLNSPLPGNHSLGGFLNQIANITDADELSLLSDFLLFLEMRHKFSNNKE